MSRRSVLRNVGLLGGAAALSSCSVIPPLRAVGGLTITDPVVFNFALNLEYLEAEYYLRGTTGAGLVSHLGEKPGVVRGGRKVPFTSRQYREFAEELADNEVAHVRFLRQTLGDAAIDRPSVDFDAGFAALGRAAGLGDHFDAFASEQNFFLGGMLFEDVGITAYKGASALIADKKLLEDAAGILAVEAYHMGMVRSVLYQMGQEAQDAANAISDARDELDGPADLDQGIRAGGKANIVPSDHNGVVFGRTPNQVLNILYLSPTSGTVSGGFYPDGVNGFLRST